MSQINWGAPLSWEIGKSSGITSTAVLSATEGNDRNRLAVCLKLTTSNSNELHQQARAAVERADVSVATTPNVSLRLVLQEQYRNRDGNWTKGRNEVTLTHDADAIAAMLAAAVETFGWQAATTIATSRQTAATEQQTAEQRRIAELEAELAKLKAQAAAKPSRKAKKAAAEDKPKAAEPEEQGAEELAQAVLALPAEEQNTLSRSAARIMAIIREAKKRA